ncbi:MAG TPA: hypothetical protein DCW45_01810 [Opitutae bacterium]|nr:hypothetical protein [Opitutae bacterium]
MNIATHCVKEVPIKPPLLSVYFSRLGFFRSKFLVLNFQSTTWLLLFPRTIRYHHDDIYALFKKSRV